MIKVKEDMTGWNMWEHGVPDSRLTVIEQTEDYIEPSGKHRDKWICKCSCGNQDKIIVVGKDLRRGHTKSCGCLKLEFSSELGKTRAKINKVDLKSKEYGIGYTTKGEEFWFDKEDYDKIKNYCWYYDSKGYVTARGKNDKNAVFLHVLVMSPVPAGMIVDHKKHPPRNEKKIDNRKCNLEIKTSSQNNMNCVCYSNNTSGVKGISWHKRLQKWRAYIQFNKKPIYLGYFTDKQDAIDARKKAEEKYFGKYGYDANNN